MFLLADKVNGALACDFTCNDGTCQTNEKRCNGVNDCSDGIGRKHALKTYNKLTLDTSYF